MPPATFLGACRDVINYTPGEKPGVFVFGVQGWGMITLALAICVAEPLYMVSNTHAVSSSILWNGVVGRCGSLNLITNHKASSFLVFKEGSLVVLVDRGRTFATRD